MNFPIINQEVAQRIQQSEIDFFSSRILSIGERSGNPEGVEILNLGKTTAFYIRTMPWAVFNSVMGFTHEDVGRLDEIIQFYRERKRPFHLNINPVGCNPEFLKYLTVRGFYQESFHSVLYGLPSREDPKLPNNIKIREVADDEDFYHYAGIHCVGSGMSINHKHHFVNNNKGLLNRSGWKIYLATLNDIPAAVAVMHINNSIASFTLAATAPKFRNNGLHTALIQWRMFEAYKEKSEFIVAQANVASTSQNNMERMGMRMAWSRAVWVPVST